MQGHFDKSIFKGKSKTSSVKWVFFAGIAGYLIGVFFYLMEGNRVFGLEMDIQEPGFIRELLIEIPVKKVDELVNKITKKQVDFNDKNENQGQAVENSLVSEVRRLFGGVAKTTTIAWQWKTGKSSRSGSFTYTQKKNIDTEKVCSNYKYGSLMYKDCRKAARKYFRDMCSSEFTAACRASTMIL
ncbi:MAG TPA: hypothetical protein VJY83_02425 [Thiopseudomonas sp.]|nr:hypothetical protein [Thiopseudomonas sp.]